jgi:hypothetical protein
MERWPRGSALLREAYTPTRSACGGRGQTLYTDKVGAYRAPHTLHAVRAAQLGAGFLFFTFFLFFFPFSFFCFIFLFLFSVLFFFYSFLYVENY